MQIHHDSILTLELPYREHLALRRTVFCGGHGPKAVVLAGVHGDELEGLYVCHRLAAWLKDLAATRPSALLGQVELFPAMNPLGLDTLTRLVPVYETDLNRNFPGHPQGPLPQRIAEAAMRHLRDAALVIDIHASNIFLREIPQVRINQTFAERLVPLARRMNVDLIWLHGAVTVLEATIAHSLNSLGVPCLVVEMGVGMRVTPAFTEQLVIGILHLWRDLGVLAADLEIPAPSRMPLLADDHNVHYLNAETSGLFIPTVAHWISVRTGELLGRIVSPHHEGILSEVRSPVHGILFTLREYPLVYEGSLMARIMAMNEAGEDQGKGTIVEEAQGGTMTQRVLLHMTAPLREDFDIPYHDIGAEHRPPRIALVAGLHGNELNGVFVLSRLAAFLQGVTEGQHPSLQLRERAIIIPAVNILGLNTLNRHWPFDNTDINRMFPGYDAGETTQRIAHAVLEITRPAHYRIDLHSASLEFEELAHVRLYDPTEDERATSRLFGLPAVIERPTNAIFTATIGHAWKAYDGENIVLRAGYAGNLQLPHCEQLFRALVVFLQRTGILQGAPAVEESEEDVHYFGVEQTARIVAETAGLFISHLEVGRWLQAGDLIGHVFDGFDGQLRLEVKTPVSGLLSGIRRQPLLFEGDLIARIQCARP